MNHVNYILTKELSAPLIAVHAAYIDARQFAEHKIKSATGCDQVFWSNHGSSYLGFKEKQVGDDWRKNPQVHYDDGRYFLMELKVKAQQYKIVAQAESELKAVKRFNEACKELFPQCDIQVIGDGNGRGGFSLLSTGFGIAKGHVLMRIPFANLDQIKSIKIPEGFEEISDIKLAELEASE